MPTTVVVNVIEGAAGNSESEWLLETKFQVSPNTHCLFDTERGPLYLLKFSWREGAENKVTIPKDTFAFLRRMIGSNLKTIELHLLEGNKGAGLSSV